MATTAHGWRLLLVALSTLAAGCGALGQEPEAEAASGPPILRIGLPTGVTSFANADVLVAKEKGVLADYGVAAEIQNFRSGVSVVQAVTEGKIDIGASSIEPVVNAAPARKRAAKKKREQEQASSPKPSGAVEPNG